MPNSRRPRAILICDEIFAKVCAYVLGNVVISIIAGAGTFLWLTIFGVPYAVLLAILVAILDLVPVVGSTAAGIILSLTALTVCVPVCLATVGFFVAYRVIEDYLLVPKIIGRFVQIPALVTVSRCSSAACCSASSARSLPFPSRRRSCSSCGRSLSAASTTLSYVVTGPTTRTVFASHQE